MRMNSLFPPVVLGIFFGDIENTESCVSFRKDSHS